MSSPGGVSAQPSPKRRRWVVPAVVGIAVMLVGVVVLFVVPFHSASKEVQFTPGESTTTNLSIPQAGWVTVHFDRQGGQGMGPGMLYWMEGPGGMMFNHSMMAGGDSYSFWTWGGGTYRCGVGYSGGGSGMMHVWVNATWGLV